MIYVINLCQSGLVIKMNVTVSVGKKWKIRGEGNKGQAKKAKTKQCFVEGFLLSMLLSFQKNYFSVLYFNSKGKQNIILKSGVSKLRPRKESIIAS